MESKKRAADKSWSDGFAATSKFVAVRKADVPKYLHDSKFYQSLEDSDEEIFVPHNCFKLDDRVHTIENLHHLLQTLRFWIADPMIKTIVEFVLCFCPFEIVESVLSEFYTDFPDLTQIEYVRFGGNDMNCAIKSGILPIVQYLLKTGHSWPNDAGKLIAKTGDVGMLKYALKTGCVLRRNECQTAARHGHLQCLKYLHEELHCPWDEDTTYNAVKGGHVDCLIYAHENGCPWDASAEEHTGFYSAMFYTNICTAAATCGDVACLKYAHTQGVPLVPNFLRSIAIHHSSSTDCFEYARAQGAAWTTGLYSRAITADNFPLLQYLHEHGCPWNGPSDCTAAAEYGRLRCLVYLHEHGCPWNVNACNTAVHNGNIGILLYLLRHGCPVCASLFSLEPCDEFEEVLTCFLERGLTWEVTPRATLDCISRRNFKGLELLIKNGCPWHPKCYGYAMICDNFEMFKWVHELGAPWQESTCLWIARDTGSLEWLQYAHTRGATISPATCKMIMQKNVRTADLLECFKYAHQHGHCVLHREYAEQSAREGQYELLNYLHAQGCGVRDEANWRLPNALGLIGK